MTPEIEISCYLPLTLEGQGYVFRDQIDKGRNALVVPQPVLDSLEISEYEYVTLSETGETQKQSIHLQVLSFEDIPVKGSPWKASLRTNLLDKLSAEHSADSLTIKPYNVRSSDQLISYPGYSDNIYEYNYCYLSEQVRAAVDATLGDYVEVYNPEHGGRMALRVRPLRATDEADKIRMSGQARNVLQTDTGDEVRVRECVHAQPAQLRWWERVLTPIVGFRQLDLKVRRGLDRDEHRNVVRISEDLIELLAIDPGDQIMLEWNGTSTAVRCLSPEYDNLESMEIKVPSTIRDRFDVSIHDALHVRRNTLYILRKQVALSTLGILGVIVGTLQLAIYLDLAITTAFLISLIMSIVVVWLLLLPERQRCARGDRH